MSTSPDRESDFQALDTWLAASPVRASAGFEDRVLVVVARERRRRVIRFSLAAFGAVACAVVAFLPAVVSPPDVDARLARLVAADADLRALVALTGPASASTGTHGLDALGAVLSEENALFEI